MITGFSVLLVPRVDKPINRQLLNQTAAGFLLETKSAVGNPATLLLFLKHVTIIVFHQIDGRVFGETVIGRGVYKKEIKIC